MKRNLAIVICAAVVMLTMACQLSPETQAALRQLANDRLQTGAWTREQYDAFLKGISGARDWWVYPVQSLIDIAAALFGVKLWRGGIMNRKGLVEVTDGTETKP